MRLTRQALRQDWPTSTRVKQEILERLIGFLDPKSRDNMLTSDRTVIMAARTIAAFCGLTLRQAALDLRREKQEGKASEVSLADLVADAEQRAEERQRERETQ